MKAILKKQNNKMIPPQIRDANKLIESIPPFSLDPHTIYRLYEEDFISFEEWKKYLLDKTGTYIPKLTDKKP